MSTHSTRRIGRRLAVAATALLLPVYAAAPAAADCLALQVTYTPPGGTTTSVGSTCLAPTPFPSVVEKDMEGGTTSTGRVTIMYRIPVP